MAGIVYQALPEGSIQNGQGREVGFKVAPVFAPLAEDAGTREEGRTCSVPIAAQRQPSQLWVGAGAAAPAASSAARHGAAAAVPKPLTTPVSPKMLLQLDLRLL